MSDWCNDRGRAQPHRMLVRWRASNLTNLELGETFFCFLLAAAAEVVDPERFEDEVH